MTEQLPEMSREIRSRTANSIHSYLQLLGSRKLLFGTIGLLILIAILPIILKHLIPQWGPGVEPVVHRHEGLGLQILVEEVTQDLYNADKKKRESGEAHLFSVETLDLEITFIVRTTHSADGHVNYDLIAVDDEMSLSNERVQRVSLHMKAIPPRQERVSPSDHPINSSKGPTVVLTPPQTQKGDDR